MNGILLVDKPQDFTSHDVVAKLRGILRERRIGHAGTLDPMATGLMTVFVGRATRAVEFAESHEKEYLAHLRPGVITDTQDITGTVLSRSDFIPTKAELLAVLPEFTGEIIQIPPMYSAIKVGGKKLYELARRGIEVEREGRPVTIKALELLDETQDGFSLRVVCSKGTYIRTLCHDIGLRLGCGAALSALRRTRAGCFSVDDAFTLEEIAARAQQGDLESLFLPTDSLFMQFLPLTLNSEQYKKCLCGNSVPFSASDGNYRVYAPDGGFMLFGRVENGVLSTIKSFFEV